MIAFYVHDYKKENDTIVIPEMGCSISVTADVLEKFISVNPDFSEWSGDACGHLSPQDFGVVIATRDDQGDVCVTQKEKWAARMLFYMNSRK